MRLLFRLALAVGEPRVGHRAGRLTLADFLHWQAFAAAEPFGGPQADLRAYYAAALPAAAVGGDAPAPGDLFPSLRPDGGRPPDRTRIGRGFRAWALSNTAEVVPVEPSRRAAR